jgi:rhodanese-related sulfurtransferase
MARDPDLQVLDVRERHEWEDGHILGSHFTAWHDVRSATPAGLDAGRPIAVVCAGGIRSATAASLLKLHGAREVIHVVDGGVSALARRGMRLESGHEPAAEVPA